MTNGSHLGAIWTLTKTLIRKYHRSRINRYSDTTRCSSIQLPKDSTVKQIILAGDVSENPGPVPTQVGQIHPCSVCTKTVTARHRAVLCDTCQLWRHIKCGSISAKAYSKMMKTLDLVWVCPTCTNGNSSLSRSGPSQQEGQPESGDNGIEAYAKLKQEIKGPGISMAHINIPGLVKNLSEVKILLQYTQIDLPALTETHLTDRIDDSEICIDGYEIIPRDRKNKQGGGCPIYYKNYLDILELRKYDSNELEALWTELTLCSQRLVVRTVYRPPDQANF